MQAPALLQQLLGGLSANVAFPLQSLYGHANSRVLGQGSSSTVYSMALCGFPGHPQDTGIEVAAKVIQVTPACLLGCLCVQQRAWDTGLSSELGWLLLPCLRWCLSAA